MRFSSFLIKYAEIAIKGGNRKFFETALVQQIKNTLKHVEGSFRVVRMNGRIYVECLSEYDYDEVTEALKTVFGISWICPVQRIEDHGFEDLLEKTAEYFRAVYDRLDFTFKVEARRARKDFPVDSQTMNRHPHPLSVTLSVCGSHQQCISQTGNQRHRVGQQYTDIAHQPQ